jgi:hypothetical protein
MKRIIAFFVEAFCIFIISKLILKGYLTKNTHTHTYTHINVDNANQQQQHTPTINNTYTYTYDYTKHNVTCNELGIHTWTVLHSIAASYANYPNETEKRNFERFFNGLMHIYPSHSSIMQKIIENTPLEHNSREELVYYICDIHNQMNKALGKKKFSCKNAFDIWGGDCGCNTNN